MNALVLLAALAFRAAAQEHDHHMPGMLGEYGMTREAGGTSWAPESTPFIGLTAHRGPWMLMGAAAAFGVYDRQGGPRGDEKSFSASSFMAMAQRPLANGTIGFRAMGSFDPAMGRSGYPLLFQTGETADGREELVDRQHPHDLFMELGASYSRPAAGGSAFGYLALVGEPALGPPAFMHRFSSMENPQAPLSHHWLDSTHIAYGVATAGWIWKGVKLEGSAFRGREPDQRRWDLERPALDSYCARLSWNPSADWSLQVSHGRLKAPEQLTPDADARRTTASASWSFRPFGLPGQATFAWGRNDLSPGSGATDAFLLEASARAREGHTIFGRVERVDKDELFGHSSARHGERFTIHAFSAGYLWDFLRRPLARLGVGAVGTLNPVPASLRSEYGRSPAASFMLFLRARLG